MSNIQFRRLRDEEFDQAYSIICDAVDWLLSKNIRQWTIPFPRKIYEQWQHKGENFALVYDSALAVVVSLAQYASPHWIDKTVSKQVWWLTKLATAHAFHGRSLGQKAVQEAKKSLHNIGIEEVYLDCVYGDGFLLRYYESLGFELRDRKKIVYPTGIFDMVLMKCSLMEQQLI